MLSTIFVAVSIVGMTISTLEILQYQDASGNTIDNPTLAMIETVCIAWFTLEYFIRLAGAPDKWAFLKDGMNVVDVLAIMPFFVSLFFSVLVQTQNAHRGVTVLVLPIKYLPNLFKVR